MNNPVVIGGSAGSFSILFKVFNKLQSGFNFPLIICVHRLRSATDSPLFIDDNPFSYPILEPADNTPVENGSVYIAPPNKHLCFSNPYTFKLSDDPPKNYSRPSIDYFMTAAADVFQSRLVGILLTGANGDGSYGLKAINDAGGISIVQDPKDSEIPIMPQSALDLFTPNYILSAEKIISFIEKLTHST